MSRPRSSLFVASFLMLFVELASIRGTTAADVYLSFFTNPLLASSSIGLGFLPRSRRRDALRWSPLLLSGVLLFLLLFPVRVGAPSTASPSSWDSAACMPFRNGCPCPRSSLVSSW